MAEIATRLDYADIESQCKNLTARMRAFIMAQETPVSVIGKRICVTLPLEWVAEEIKKGKKKK
jgi:hypothetical protein